MDENGKVRERGGGERQIDGYRKKKERGGQTRMGRRRMRRG